MLDSEFMESLVTSSTDPCIKGEIQVDSEIIIQITIASGNMHIGLSQRCMSKAALEKRTPLYGVSSQEPKYEQTENS